MPKYQIGKIQIINVIIPAKIYTGGAMMLENKFVTNRAIRLPIVALSYKTFRSKWLRSAIDLFL